MSLEIHTTYNNHTELARHLVARGPEGLDGVVLEAKHLDRHSDLIEQARGTGVHARVDPCTFELTTLAATELPFGPDEAVIDLATLESWTDVSALTENVVNQAEGVATVLTPPYLYVTGDQGAVARRLELNARYVTATRRLEPNATLVPILAISRRDLLTSGLDALDDYIGRLAASDVAGLEVRVGPLTNRSSAAVVASIFSILDHLRTAGVPGVRLGQNPTVGIAAFSSGLVDGLTTGILDKQSVDVAGLLSRRNTKMKKKAAGQKTSGGGGAYKRVYLPSLGLTVDPAVAEVLFNDTAHRGSVRCRDADCAATIAAPLNQPRRHDLHSRIAEHEELAGMPAVSWRRTAHRRKVVEQIKAAERIGKSVPGLTIPVLLGAVRDTLAADDPDTMAG